MASNPVSSKVGDLTLNQAIWVQVLTWEPCYTRMMKLFNNLKENAHTYLLLFWVAMVPITLLFLRDSVLWVALMSLYANIEASAAAREAKKSGRS